MLKKLAYISVFTSLVGAKFFSINLDVFQLSIFRILIIFMVFAMFIMTLLRNGKINLTKNSFSIKFMLFWLIYAFMTLAWVEDYGSWFRAVYFLALGVVSIFIFSETFKNIDDILFAFRIMTIMMMIHNLIGWYEINTGNYLFLPMESLEKYAYYHYPASMFTNSNDFATLMLFSIFISYICVVNSNRIIVKIVYLCTIISSVLLIIMANSRANLIGMILAFSVFFYFSVKKKRGRRILLAISIILFGVILVKPEVFTSILMDVNQNLDVASNVESDIIRTNLYKNGFVFLINTFGFGTGAGNIEYWMANFGEYNTGGIINIHNWWLEILTGYGIVIFVLYVTFYFKLFRSLSLIYRNSKEQKTASISLAVMCCMTGFVIGSLSSSSNISSEWLWVFWGIAIALQVIGKRDIVTYCIK